MDNQVQLSKRHKAVHTSRTFKRICNLFALQRKRVFDVGCGYGEYLAAFGPGSVGITTTHNEVLYGREHGLDIREGNAERLGSLSLETLFEVAWANNLLEHLLAPHEFLMRLRKTVEPDGMLILGVPVLPYPRVLMRLRRFRGALASNHINFFTHDSLKLTVTRAGWQVLEVRPFIFKNSVIDKALMLFMPHAYVVARSDASFKYPEKKVNEWVGEEAYAEILALGTP